MKSLNLVSVVILGYSSLAAIPNAAAEDVQHTPSVQLPLASHKPLSDGGVVTSDSLRIYFKNVLTSNDVNLRDIAEALFVSPSTISEFITRGMHSDYVVSQYTMYTSHSRLDLPDQKKESNKISVTSYEEVSSCFQEALSRSIMPSKLRSATTLKVYFDSLLGKNAGKINECDRILRLDGRLNQFLASDNPDVNLTSSVYTHLLSYYRGVRLVLKDRFRSLEDALSDYEKENSRSFLSLISQKWFTKKPKTKLF